MQNKLSKDRSQFQFYRINLSCLTIPLSLLFGCTSLLFLCLSSCINTHSINEEDTQLLSLPLTIIILHANPANFEDLVNDENTLGFFERGDVCDSAGRLVKNGN